MTNKLDQRFISEEMTNDDELLVETTARISDVSNLQGQINDLHNVATSTTNGLMSYEDKNKLDYIYSTAYYFAIVL